MKYTWLVEKYLEGEMSGKELTDFELLILRNEEVAREIDRVRKLLEFSRQQHERLAGEPELIEDYRDAANVIDADEIEADLDNLRIRKVPEEANGTNFLEKIRKQVRSGSSGQKHIRIVSMLRFNLWLTAAAIALLLSVGALLLNRSAGTTDYMALYDMNFHPYQPELITRGAGAVTNDKPDYRKGLDEYKKANYSLALEYLDTSTGKDPDFAYGHLFRGLSLMELGRFDEALSSFGQLKNDRALDDYGLWYSGLCCLRMEQRDRAKDLFRKLVSEDSYFAPQARKLLRKL